MKCAPVRPGAQQGHHWAYGIARGAMHPDLVAAGPLAPPSSLPPRRMLCTLCCCASTPLSTSLATLLIPLKGVWEKDEDRKHDSFRAFEEVLALAVQHDVDMVLLGGDLFHDNKPSRTTVIRAIELLNKYCLGDKPVQFRLLSDQQQNFVAGCVRGWGRGWMGPVTDGPVTGQCSRLVCSSSSSSQGMI